MASFAANLATREQLSPFSVLGCFVLVGVYVAKALSRQLVEDSVERIDSSFHAVLAIGFQGLRRFINERNVFVGKGSPVIHLLNNRRDGGTPKSFKFEKCFVLSRTLHHLVDQNSYPFFNLERIVLAIAIDPLGEYCKDKCAQRCFHGSILGRVVNC